MDFRVVLVPLCVLFTQARCRPAGSREEAQNRTIGLALQEIRIVRDHLDESLPVSNCRDLNVPEPVGLKQRPLSAQRLSTVRCYLQQVSERIHTQSNWLNNATQFIKNVEEQLSDSTTPQSCGLLGFQDKPDDYVLAKCFLELVLEDRPGKSTL